jgi:hypothetical protein
LGIFDSAQPMQFVVFKHALETCSVRPTVHSRSVPLAVFVHETEAPFVLAVVEVLLHGVIPILVRCFFEIAQELIALEWHGWSCFG